MWVGGMDGGVAIVGQMSTYLLDTDASGARSRSNTAGDVGPSHTSIGASNHMGATSAVIDGAGVCRKPSNDLGSAKIPLSNRTGPMNLGTLPSANHCQNLEVRPTHHLRGCALGLGTYLPYFTWSCTLPAQS